MVTLLGIVAIFKLALCYIAFGARILPEDTTGREQAGFTNPLCRNPITVFPREIRNCHARSFAGKAIR